VQPDCVSYEYTISLKSGAVSGCAATQTVTHAGMFQVTHGVVNVTQLRSGENTLLLWALDAAGNRQAEPIKFTWKVLLAGSTFDLNITGGPPQRPLLYGWSNATLQMQATSKGVVQLGAGIEVQWGQQPWSSAGVLCDPLSGLCNFTLSSMALGEYLLQARAVDAESGLAGDPQSWSWQVAECSAQEYAQIGLLGNLTCMACPPGGNCTVKGTTLATVKAQPDWWAPPLVTGRNRTFYPCPLPGSCLGGNTSTQCNKASGFSNSTLCGQCTAGRVRFRDECVECPSAEEGAVVVTLLYLALVGGIWWMTKAELKNAGLDQEALEHHEQQETIKKIVVTYLVTLSTVGDLKAR
jgi:hypothetical protein